MSPQRLDSGTAGTFQEPLPANKAYWNPIKDIFSFWMLLSSHSNPCMRAKSTCAKPRGLNVHFNTHHADQLSSRPHLGPLSHLHSRAQKIPMNSNPETVHSAFKRWSNHPNCWYSEPPCPGKGLHRSSCEPSAHDLNSASVSFHWSLCEAPGTVPQLTSPGRKEPTAESIATLTHHQDPSMDPQFVQSSKIGMNPSTERHLVNSNF